MASYLELIRRDAHCHQSHDSWPSSVLEFVQSLQKELRIPNWLKSGAVPYTNQRAIDLLDQLRASDDASNMDLWDSRDGAIDTEMEQRLHVVFNTALVDCASIQSVVEIENLTNTPYPKESFLVIFVRNAILEARARLSVLEDVPVVLPRHFSGVAIPILDYMKKSFYVSLIVSICQEMPIEDGGSDLEYQSSDDDNDSSSESELLKHSPPTMSEFLDGRESTKTPEEEGEEVEDDFLPPRFEAHFLACSPAASPPPICHIPVLCMADKEQLPVLMSSLLYQRRVWHISDPLIGLEFSKYDTVIRLYVGWLKDDSGRVLPRVHLGEIRTPIKLDLSSPSVALVISRFLSSLESHTFAVRDSARHTVGAVIRETQSYSSLPWRIDTDAQEKDSASILENNSTRERIAQWVKSQKYPEVEESVSATIATSSIGRTARTMPSLKQADKISVRSDSATSTPPPQQSTFIHASYQTSPSSVPLGEKDTLIPEIWEPREYADSVPTLCSRLPCSEFAATSEEEDRRVFRWMFDRRVIPQSLPSDLEFRETYSAMTGFIWPETWHVRENLPFVDAALEPCVQELLESVGALKIRPGAVKCIPVNEFPVDIRTLEQSFSAIFQASRRSREKTELQHNVCEAAWRHDHDRLLFDFFIRLLQPKQADATLDHHSVVRLEDLLTRPTLEATLRLPRNDILQTRDRQHLQRSIRTLLLHEATDLATWLQNRGAPPDADLQEAANASYVVSQWASWRHETNAENMAQMISKLGQSPSTGRCDALGCLLVQLPNVSFKAIGNFPLVVRPRSPQKHNVSPGRGDTKVSASRPKARTSRRRGETSNKLSSSSLIVPDTSRALAGTTRYTVPSSSISTSEQNKQTAPAESLAHKMDQLRLEPDATCFELPILAVENKKASDNLTKGTNQLRMYLAASVKFLQAVGITNVPVYGVQTDGPIVVLPAAILRDDNFIYLFERLVEKLDISTPLGAWHYATILCRLAQSHAKVLEEKFEQVRENLVASLLKEQDQQELGWTIDYQIARLKAENRAKSPPREKPKKERQKQD